MMDPGGEYGRSVKENQPRWSIDGEELFAWLKGPHLLDTEMRLGYNAQVDGGQGRVEPRTVWGPPA